MNDKKKTKLKINLGDREDIYFEKIFEVYKGLTNKNKTDFESNTNNFYIQFKNIHSSEIKKNSLGRVFIRECENQNNVLKNDILLTTSSENKEEIGTTNLNLLDMSNLYLNSFSYILRPKKNQNALYLHYYLKSSKIRKQIILEGQGITRINISSTRLNNILFKLHDLEKQNKIANLLSSIDILIEKQEECIEFVKKRKQGYSKIIFDSNLGDREEIKLNHYLKYVQPTKYIVKDVLDKGKTPVLTANKSFILGYTNEESIYRTNNEIILFDDFTTATKLVNFNFKVKSSALKILEKQNECNMKFIYEYLSSLEYKPESHRRHWIELFSNFKILKIDLKKQNKIADFLSSMDNLIELNQEKLEKLKLKKKYYLNEIFE